MSERLSGSKTSCVRCEVSMHVCGFYWFCVCLLFQACLVYKKKIKNNCKVV